MNTGRNLAVFMGMAVPMVIGYVLMRSTSSNGASLKNKVCVGCVFGLESSKRTEKAERYSLFVCCQTNDHDMHSLAHAFSSKPKPT